jgi:hypothetical protein
MFTVLLTMLLAACAAPADTTNDTTGDSAAVMTDDSGAQGLDPFDLEVGRGTCDALVDPWAGANAREAIDAAAAVEPDDMLALLGVFSFAQGAGDDGCPAVEEDTAGTTLVGGCSTALGWDYRGSATLLQSSGDDGTTANLTFSSFSLLHGGDDGTWRFSADGTAAFALDATGAGTISIDAVWGLERTGAFAADGDAYLSTDGAWQVTETDQRTGTTYARLVSTAAARPGISAPPGTCITMTRARIASAP